MTLLDSPFPIHLTLCPLFSFLLKLTKSFLCCWYVLGYVTFYCDMNGWPEPTLLKTTVFPSRHSPDNSIAREWDFRKYKILFSKIIFNVMFLECIHFSWVFCYYCGWFLFVYKFILFFKKACLESGLEESIRSSV